MAKFKIDGDTDQMLIKVTMDGGEPHKTGWDFIILDALPHSFQSITIGAVGSDAGYSSDVSDAFAKFVGKKTQFAEGEETFASSPEDLKMAEYHVKLHARTEDAFKITQYKTSDNKPYLHDHYAFGDGSIGSMVKCAVSCGALDMTFLTAMGRYLKTHASAATTSVQFGAFDLTALDL